MSINPLWTRPVVHSTLLGNDSFPPNDSDLFNLRTAYIHNIQLPAIIKSIFSKWLHML